MVCPKPARLAARSATSAWLSMRSRLGVACREVTWQLIPRAARTDSFTSPIVTGAASEACSRAASTSPAPSGSPVRW